MSILLELSEYRQFNVRRSEAPKKEGGFAHRLEEWSPAEWGCAVAGEAGELCNLLKKLRRGENVNPLEIADEAGDVLAYLDLATARVGISLAQAAIRKWDRVSLERGHKYLLNSRRIR